MNEEDIYCSRGPVSSMPGSYHAVPKGAMCDKHENVPAVARVQGETDSFGCEYVLECQVCVDEHREYLRLERERPRFCDWCKHEKTDVRPYRDMDEGMSGRIYDVCRECRDRDLKRWAEEYDDNPPDLGSGWL